jgi:hypothetical protein
MKKQILIIAAIAALAITGQSQPTIQIHSNYLVIGNMTSNHLYGVYQSPSVQGPYAELTKFIGVSGQKIIYFSPTNAAEFYRVSQESGFLVYSYNRTVLRGINNCGLYVGYVDYSSRSWSVDANATAHYVIDPQNLNVCIEATGVNHSSFSYGNSPMGVNPPLTDTAYRFTVYYNRSTAFPNVLQLVGFNE